MKHTIKLAPKPVAPAPAQAFGDSDQALRGVGEPTSYAAIQKAAAGDDYVPVPPCFPSGIRNAGSIK